MDKGFRRGKTGYRFRRTWETTMSPAPEMAMLRGQVREQEKEIRRLKEEKEFLE
jgi:hypothetical protein